MLGSRLVLAEEEVLFCVCGTTVFAAVAPRRDAEVGVLFGFALMGAAGALLVCAYAAFPFDVPALCFAVRFGGIKVHKTTKTRKNKTGKEVTVTIIRQ